MAILRHIEAPNRSVSRWQGAKSQWPPGGTRHSSREVLSGFSGAFKCFRSCLECRKRLSETEAETGFLIGPRRGTFLLPFPFFFSLSFFPSSILSSTLLLAPSCLATLLSFSLSRSRILEHAAKRFRGYRLTRNRACSRIPVGLQINLVINVSICNGSKFCYNGCATFVEETWMKCPVCCWDAVRTDYR